MIFATDSPKPNLNLLDRFLVMMAYQDVPVQICFNKEDLGADDEKQQLREIYEKAGYPVHFTQATTGQGEAEIFALLQGKTTTVAGPSGVGKSSFINGLQDHTTMETGNISEKIGRGKHTTRHSELIPIAEDSFIMDTPGFSSMYVPEIEAGQLWEYFPEFVPHEPECRFQGCAHIGEPDCGIKEALARGEIAQSRYDNYKLLYEELMQNKKY